MVNYIKQRPASALHCESVCNWEIVNKACLYSIGILAQKQNNRQAHRIVALCDSGHNRKQLFDAVTICHRLRLASPFSLKHLSYSGQPSDDYKALFVLVYVPGLCIFGSFLRVFEITGVLRKLPVQKKVSEYSWQPRHEED